MGALRLKTILLTIFPLVLSVSADQQEENSGTVLSKPGVQKRIMIFTHVESSWGQPARLIRDKVNTALLFAKQNKFKNFLALSPFFAGDLSSFIQVGAPQLKLLSKSHLCETNAVGGGIDALNLCEQNYLPENLDQKLTHFWMSQGGAVTDPLDNYYFSENIQTFLLNRGQKTRDLFADLLLKKRFRPSFNFNRRPVFWNVNGKNSSLPLAKSYYLGGGYLTECFCNTVNSIFDLILSKENAGVVSKEFKSEVTMNLMTDAIYTSDIVSFFENPDLEDYRDLSLNQLSGKKNYQAAFEKLFVGVELEQGAFSCLSGAPWNDRISELSKELFLKVNYQNKAQKCLQFDVLSFKPVSCESLNVAKNALTVNVNLLRVSNLKPVKN